jgi:hypothetical protein
MKKNFLLALVFVLVSLSNAMADSLLWDTLDADDGYTNNSFSIDTMSFIFSNESRSGFDDFSDIYLGYYSPLNEYSGYYLGTFEGNTDSAGEGTRILALVERYLDFYNLEHSANYETGSYYKVDKPDETTSNSFTSGPLTVTWDLSTGAKNGTWEFTDESLLSLGFYAVKGAQEFSLYFVDPARTSGNWSTIHLKTPNDKNIPEISHFSGLAGVTTVVPEPSTFLLFGIGLIGLGLATRRRIAF